MNMDSRFVVPPQVMARTVGAETVILDLESGTYFGLDPVGTRIWQLFELGQSMGQVCTVMVEEYEVPRDVIERDALALARELADKKLIRMQEVGL